MLIVTGSDDNYVPGVLVLIASAAFHNAEVRFAVLDMGISDRNRERIDKLGELLGVSIVCFEIKEGSFADLSVRRSHLTKGTFLRFQIPELFPDEDRAIYLDCDMVVVGSLEELNHVDLRNNIIAAVHCPSPDQRELAITGHVRGTYINAGMLVMNLPVWRKEQISDKCIEILTDTSATVFSEDQSAINIIAKDRIQYMPSRYNVYADYCSYERVEDFPSDPAILHYVVSNKPWNWATNLAEVWNFHARQISVVMPPRKEMTFRRRLSLLNRNRKMILGNILARKKYRVRRQLRRHMNEVFGRRYLARFTGAKKEIK